MYTERNYTTLEKSSTDRSFRSYPAAVLWCAVSVADSTQETCVERILQIPLGNNTSVNESYRSHRSGIYMSIFPEHDTNLSLSDHQNLEWGRSFVSMCTKKTG